MENNPKQSNLNEIYTYLINKANNRLRNLDIASDSLMYYHIGNCMCKISDIFLQAMKDKIDARIFSDLELITFANKEIDNEILALTEERIKRELESKLYIKAKGDSDKIYMPLDIENNRFVKWSLNGILFCTVSKEEQEREFVSLESYLTKENLIWQQAFTTTSSETLLYSLGNGRILSFRESFFKYKKRIRIIDSHSLSGCTYMPCPKDTSWQNKEFIIAEIIKQINEDLNRDSNKECKKR